MNEKELIKLKKKVDAAEYETQQLKGQRNAILDNLKEDFKCNSIEEAEEAKNKLKKKLKKFSEELDEKLKQIEKEYLPDEES